jgi:hypothetical protein
MVDGGFEHYLRGLLHRVAQHLHFILQSVRDRLIPLCILLDYKYFSKSKSKLGNGPVMSRCVSLAVGRRYFNLL